MGKVGKQSKENKKKFWSPLLNILKANYFKTKQEIADELVGSLSDRAIRDEINSVRKFYAVISSSQEKGYRLMQDLDELSTEDLQKEYALVNRTCNEFQSRIDDMRKSQKPLIAGKRVIEKKLRERGIGLEWEK